MKKENKKANVLRREKRWLLFFKANYCTLAVHAVFFRERKKTTSPAPRQICPSPATPEIAASSRGKAEAPVPAPRRARPALPPSRKARYCTARRTAGSFSPGPSQALWKTARQAGKTPFPAGTGACVPGPAPCAPENPLNFVNSR